MDHLSPEEQRREELRQAINAAGGVPVIARLLGMTRSALYQHIKAGAIPTKYCPTIERFCDGKTRCEVLNKDVDWGYLRRNSSVDPIAA
ncbi:YdaS family helix-turn-helix protein [Cupriavidus basilensis]|uniref:YdaS family helix-turn-helix protein n=1 Tax=Cupriavidus basilensis TaxID=68895 RepID=UPI0009E53981|nr:YdaS family helix-turn-helix protein [Cupriavidus basilensis]